MIVKKKKTKHNKKKKKKKKKKKQKKKKFIRMPSQNEVYPDVTINLGRIYARMVLGEILEYSCAAESPIQCGVSHLLRWNEPL